MALAAKWRARRHADDVLPDDDIDWVAVRRAVRADASASDDGWLLPDALERMLSGSGIPLAVSATARSAQEAADVVERLGTTVVMKAIVPGVLHKTEAGAVVLGVVGPQAAASTYAAFESRFGQLDGVVVQVQVPPGPELLVGGRQDAVAGPLVVVAAGGIETELLADRAIRAAPFSPAVARQLLLSLRTSARLTGFRGSAPVDLELASQVVARVARLVTLVPELVEFEINPLVAGTTTAIAVDARGRADLAAGRPLPLR